MTEIEALAKIDEAMSNLKDESARLRVLQWAISRFANENAISLQKKLEGGPSDALDSRESKKDEIAGIATITENGRLFLTIRDLKAKSTNDAAIRIALITIFSYCKLTGLRSTSSRKVLKPILEEYRAYTPNTRAMIANHPGILRDGDSLSLDVHAEREAEKYIQEVLDGSIKGTWQPKKSRKKSEGVNSSKHV